MAAAVSALVSEGIPGETPVTTHFLVTCDASYPAGGYPITPAQAGFVNNIRNLVCGFAAVGATIYYAFWDNTAKKIRIIVGATGVEAGAINIATLAFVCTAFGD
jgi:hypothetical protein